MKILLIERSLEPAGAVTISLNAADQLKKAGHRVKIAAIFSRMGSGYCLPNKFWHHIFQKNQLLATFLGPLFLLKVIWREADWADILNPTTFPTHWLTVIIGKLKHKPVVWSCYEPFIKYRLSDIGKVGWSSFIVSLIARGPWDIWLGKRMDRVVSISLMVAGWVKKRYLIKSVVNYPGIDAKIYFTDPKIKKDHQFVLLNIGLLSPMKNQEFLIKLIPRLQRFVPSLKLILVGGGPQEKFLKKLSQDLGVDKQVSFRGPIYNLNKITNLYRSASLFLFPAVRQSWGMVPFEALTAGIPVIVSDDCGAAEVIVDQKIGQILPLKLLLWEKAIIKVFQNQDVFNKQAIKGQQYVKKYLTWKGYGQNLEKELIKAYDSFNHYR